MFYSGWQALYGTYCIGTNKLSIYRRFMMIVFCILLTPSVFGRKFCGTYPDFVDTPPRNLSCSDKGVTIISPQDITPQGYVIDKPGTYCVSGNVSFKPDKPGRAAITITGKGVKLLLDDLTLTQKGSTPNTHGILINKGFETIVHGVNISGFTGNGIYAKGCVALVLDTITSSYNKGKIGNGILLENSDGIFIILCTVKSNSGKGISVTGDAPQGGPPSVMMEYITAKKNGADQDIDFS